MRKIELSADEQILFNELKKLSKRANQRILRLQRLTGLEEPFDVKQLSDYLSLSEVNGLTKSGKVKYSKSMTLEQMKNTIKATENFLNKDISTQGQAKREKEKIEKSLGVKSISWEQANAFYQSFSNYTWIYEYMSQSEFWIDYGNPARFGEISQNDFVEMLKVRIKKTDKIFEQALINLYNYCRYGGGYEAFSGI